ncbi:putative Cysteine and glycine-rich protein 3 [Blattamonas nauphoetae]|uniref:Cysteine and glycine-rich protein 3 n=1 Tax=Blattamonas nauphoetae TaxID=2049346 RepID=A0ABQ9Y5K0_9EUKA|nr:putative Cysteine and glycine-rich protein 3 [Blattamonas nauphoetae]
MSEVCPTCNKRVYQAEWVLGLGRYYHRACLQCLTCKKVLKTNEIVEHDGKPYCKTCYGRQFAPTGYGYGGTVSSYVDQTKVADDLERVGAPVNQTDTTANPTQRGAYASGVTGPDERPSPASKTTPSPATSSTGVTPSPKSSSASPQSATYKPPTNVTTSGPICPTCGKRVYAAEELVYNERKYHKLCFKCKGCGNRLTKGKQLDGNGEPYCENCYNKTFRVQGYGAQTGLSSYLKG